MRTFLKDFGKQLEHYNTGCSVLSHLSQAGIFNPIWWSRIDHVAFRGIGHSQFHDRNFAVIQTGLFDFRRQLEIEDRGLIVNWFTNRSSLVPTLTFSCVLDPGNPQTDVQYLNWVNRNGPDKIHHVAFVVEDIQYTVDRCVENSIVVGDVSVSNNGKFLRAITEEGPCGQCVEFVEHV